MPICGTPGSPRVAGDGDPIEFAVKMREFPQQALAGRVLARGELTPLHIDALAECVADFHARAQAASDNDRYGAPEANLAACAQNFAQMRDLQPDASYLPVVDRLEAWSLREHSRRHEAFLGRRRQGRVRECHGDLHLGIHADDVVGDGVVVVSTWGGDTPQGPTFEESLKADENGDGRISEEEMRKHHKDFDEFGALDTDSDGFIDPLIPVWMDAGIDILYPFEVQAGMDVLAVRKRYGRDLRIWGGVDKRPLAEGPEAIRRELERIRPLISDGGYIPMLDHAATPDTPYHNYRYFLGELRKIL